MPKKRSRKKPLTQKDKKNNRQLSSNRILNENIIGSLKRFKIISDRYRNRRKKFSLRFNLIAGIYNLELAQWISGNRKLEPFLKNHFDFLYLVVNFERGLIMDDNLQHTWKVGEIEQSVHPLLGEKRSSITFQLKFKRLQ